MTLDMQTIGRWLAGTLGEAGTAVLVMVPLHTVWALLGPDGSGSPASGTFPRPGCR